MSWVQRRDVRVDRPAATEGHQRASADIRSVGDGDADPPLPEIDAEQAAQGGGSAGSLRTSTRASSVGTDVTQSGHTDSSAWP